MKKTRPWVAFYSFTGSEIVNLIRNLPSDDGELIRPDCVCTNNYEGQINFVERNIYYSQWGEHEYREILSQFDNPVVTLNGWMRIIPAQICDEFEIYNGHPALISEYPELKGKDKQEDVINQVDKYPLIGSVIHRCTPVLDDGEIVEEERVHNMQVVDEHLIYEILKNTSLITWLRFLPTVL